MKKYLSFIICLCCLFPAFFSANAAPPETAPLLKQNNSLIELTAEERAWLAEHPVIRVANEDGWPPFDFVSGGQPVGLCVDLAKLVAKRLGIELEFVTSNDWKGLLQKARQKEVDLFTGLSVTDERKEFLRFTEQYMPSYEVIVVHASDESVADIDDLVGKTMALVPGYSVTEEIRKNFPDIKIIEAENLLDSLQLVAAQKADAAFGTLGAVSYAIKSNLLPDLKIAGTSTLLGMRELTGLHMAVRKDWPVFQKILQKGLDSISSKELLATQSKWLEIVDGQTAPQLSLTAAEKAWLTEHPVLRVANEDDWPPYDFSKNGSAQGLSIDLMNELAGRLGIQLEYINGFSWDELLEKGRQKQIDIFPSLVDTAERRKFLKFTTPYMPTYEVIVVHRDENKVRDIGDLRGRSIALTRGYAEVELIRKHFPEIEIIETATPQEALRLVAIQKADAAYATLGFYSYEKKRSLLSELKIAGMTNLEGLTQMYQLSMAVRDDWPQLQQLLQKALDSLSDGDLLAIQQRWLENVDHEQPVDLLTPEEHIWLQQQSVVKVGLPPLPPLSFQDDAGEMVGVVADYLKLMTEKTGIEFEPVVLPWPEMMAQAKERKVDLFAGMATVERKEHFNFTAPFLPISYAIINRLETPFIGELSDLKGKKVAVIKNISIHERLERLFPELHLLPFADVPSALQAVAKGQAEAYVGPLLTASYQIQKLALNNLKVAAPAPFEDESVSFAARKDWPHLSSILDKAIKSCSREERDAILQKWLRVRFERGVDWSVVWQWGGGVGGLLSLIIFGTVYWNRRLKHEVQSRTAELLQSEEKYRDLYSNAQVGLLTTRVEDGKVIECNQKMAEIFGYQEIEECIAEYVVADHYLDPSKRQTIIETLLQTGRVDDVEAGFSRRDGAKFWARFSIKYHPENETFESVVLDITDVKYAEDALKESQDRFRAVVEQASDAIFLFDQQGAILNANQQACDSLGYSRQELLSMAAVDIETAFSAEEIMTILGDVAKKQEPKVVAGLLRRKDASLQHVEVNLGPLQISDSRLILAIMRDVTVRKKVEETLFFVSQKGWAEDHLEFLPEMAKYLGETLQMEYAVIGKILPGRKRVRTVGLFAHGEIVDDIEYDLQGTPCAGVVGQQLCRHVSGIQQAFPEDKILVDMAAESYVGTPLWDSKGEPIGLVAVLGQKPLADFELIESVLPVVAVRVAHELERLDDEAKIVRYQEHLEELVEERTHDLQTARRNLELALQGADAGSFYYNFIQDTLEWDQRSLDMFGVATVDKYDDWSRLVHPDDLLEIQAQIDRELKGEAILDLNFRIVRPDGVLRHIWAVAMIIRDEAGSVEAISGLHFDVTEKILAEAELKQSKEAAEAANRAKSVFLSNMSHELRTPLTAILGYSHLLKLNKDLPEAIRNKVEIIDRSGNHLRELINDVLEVSRIEAGRVELAPETFNLNSFLYEIEEMFLLRTQEKGLKLIFENIGTLPEGLVCDAGKLRQILINLLGNALKFTDSGSISVVTELAGDECLRISVKDTGPGIAADEQNRLFQPFEQTTSGRDKGGTGLGLVISREYARLLGGDLHVSSAAGQGSTFTVSCKVAAVQEPAVGKGDTRTISGLDLAGRQVKVLVADDIDETRRFIIQLLEQPGISIIEAKNGEDALAKLEAGHPDLVIMDMRMPIMDGYKAIRRMKKELKSKIPVVAVSASAFETDRVEIMATGADAFIRKPINAQEFYLATSQLLAVECTYLDEQSSTKETRPMEIAAGEMLALPIALRNALEQALVKLDVTAVQALLGQVAEADESLASRLQLLAKDFRYDSLLSHLRNLSGDAEKVD